MTCRYCEAVREMDLALLELHKPVGEGASAHCNECRRKWPCKSADILVELREIYVKA